MHTKTTSTSLATSALNSQYIKAMLNNRTLLNTFKPLVNQFAQFACFGNCQFFNVTRAINLSFHQFIQDYIVCAKDSKNSTVNSIPPAFECAAQLGKTAVAIPTTKVPEGANVVDPSVSRLPKDARVIQSDTGELCRD